MDSSSATALACLLTLIAQPTPTRYALNALRDTIWRRAFACLTNGDALMTLKESASVVALLSLDQAEAASSWAAARMIATTTALPALLHSSSTAPALLATSITARPTLKLAARPAPLATLSSTDNASNWTSTALASTPTEHAPAAKADSSSTLPQASASRTLPTV